MAKVAATPPLLKDLNERTVLDTIRAGAPISRAEISRRAGISKPTVSTALQSLLAAGLVRETTADPGRPTYGATFPRNPRIASKHPSGSSRQMPWPQWGTRW